MKRNKLWNSIEVCAIFQLVYTLCMSQEGVYKFGQYVSANHPNVFEPLFIAQYLLAPVNTIVKDPLLPWMMKQDGPPTTKPAKLKKSFKY